MEKNKDLKSMEDKVKTFISVIIWAVVANVHIQLESSAVHHTSKYRYCMSHYLKHLKSLGDLIVYFYL